MKILNTIKYYSTSLLVSFVFILILTFIMATFNYFNIIGSNTLSFIKIIIMIISALAGGILIGINTKDKGWLAGIRYAFVFIIFIVLLNYLGYDYGIKLKSLIYYIIIIVSSMIGSMIGINNQKKEN